MPALTDERLDIDAAAHLMGVSRRTLYSWRAADYGPRSVKFAGKLWYRRDECYRFMAQTEAATARSIR